MIECNKITEIYKGHYQVILNFPEIADLNKIIDKDYEYVWVYDHLENANKWVEYKHSKFGILEESYFALARNFKMELLIKTADFLNEIKNISQSVKLIQTNIEPPYYLDLDKLKGASKYNLLKEKVDYLFDIDIPAATDYAPIISPNKKYLESLIKKLS